MGLARLEFCLDLPGLFARLNGSSVDLLHLHAPNPTMLLGLAALRPRVPLVVTYHSDVIRQKLLRMAMRPFEHLVYRKAAIILSTSPVYSDGSVFLRGYREKLGVLPLAIDLDPYLRPNQAARDHARRVRREHGEPLWLAVGRLVYYKGLHNAIRALPAVPGKLMVIGQGPLKEELTGLAREVKVMDRVVWRPQVDPDDLVGAYHAATALWFPSNERSEGFGLVQVEAMACRCPVINAAIPHTGVAWVSKHEETGLTVPMNDPGALAAASRRLLEEPGFRNRLAAKAREQAVARFDHRVMAERSLEVYRGLLGGEGPGPDSFARPTHGRVGLGRHGGLAMPAASLSATN
jgi:rhamnosyl/mannosyltransferase